MKKLNNSLVVLFWVLVVTGIVIATSCSIQRKIEWHESQLDKYEKLYPELFTTAGLDSIIKSRAIELAGQISKEVDTAKINEYEGELSDLRDFVHRLRESKEPCDTILKEVEKIVEKEGKTKVLWRDAQCKMDTITIDTLGVHVKAWATNGKFKSRVDVDSVRVSYDCPPEPVCPDHPRTWFWEFIGALCGAMVMFVLLIRRR